MQQLYEIIKFKQSQFECFCVVQKFQSEILKTISCKSCNLLNARWKCINTYLYVNISLAILATEHVFMEIGPWFYMIIYDNHREVDNKETVLMKYNVGCINISRYFMQLIILFKFFLQLSCRHIIRNID